MNSVVDLLEAAAARTPEAVAAESGGRALTYGALDQRANLLAERLRDLGAGPDRCVGVAAERSLDLAVALWGVMKAGAACLPLDPAYPIERLAFMIDDAAPAAVVGRQVPPGCGVPLVRSAGGGGRAEAPPRAAGADHLAYVIYTSGSTGQAKGVMLTHGGLVNHHLAVADLYGLGRGDRVLQFCSLGFDASVEEMFPTWVSGATVVFRPEDVPLLGRPWVEWLGAQGITVLNLPTAYWHAWVRDLEARGETVPEAIRLVVVGGEKALGPAYRAWLRISGGRSRWINVYGPTETTCMSTFWEGGEPLGERDPPIGRPIPNTTVRVVDDRLRPAPRGEAGELLIGGAGLARGYLNRPDLTAERFVTLGAERFYRTGDLVQPNPDGDLDYLGRIDDQVKVRGFRVETGEVQAAVARHPAVAEAVVVARRDHSGDTALVGYVTGRDAGPPDAGELRRYLAGRVPPYLVPSAFVVLDALPLTPNGKVDRDRLPPPPAKTAGGARAPEAGTEARIASVWAQVLGLDPAAVGADADFFDLGGHSLLAAQAVARIREELGTETPLRAIFESPTVSALAAAVDAERASGAGAAAVPLKPRPRDPGARLPLALAQEQMWRLESAADPPGLYNVTALHDFAAPVDVGALRAALDHVVERHETLRTGIGSDEEGPFQWVVESASIELAVNGAPGAGGSPVGPAVAAQDARPFDWARPPLVRAGLFPLEGGSCRLAVTVDHLVCDGNGIFILMRDLLAAYAALAGGRAPALEPLPLQFADFALWQRANVTEAVLERQLEWWLRALDGMPLGPAVPFDHVPETPSRRIRARSFTVGAQARAALEEVARATSSTVFVVALAATQTVLAQAGGRSDIVMSTTLSGRSRAELEPLVGTFSGVGRLRGDLAGDPPFAEVVARARDFVLGLFENQDVPFMRVRRVLLPDFPTGGLEIMKAVPTEFGYFHVRDDDPELFFRGQLHPMSITLLDDGRRIAGEVRYKLDFYDPPTVDRLARDLERALTTAAPTVPVTPRDPNGT